MLQNADIRGEFVRLIQSELPKSDVNVDVSFREDGTVGKIMDCHFVVDGKERWTEGECPDANLSLALDDFSRRFCVPITRQILSAVR
jgi:hypothetical protein